jgi:hypothetical protein
VAWSKEAFTHSSDSDTWIHGRCSTPRELRALLRCLFLRVIIYINCANSSYTIYYNLCHESGRLELGLYWAQNLKFKKFGFKHFKKLWKNTMI